MLKRFTYIKKIIFSYKAWRKDKIYEGKTRAVLVISISLSRDYTVYSTRIKLKFAQNSQV